MVHSSFFSNAEAYAMEILQQKFMKDAQRSAQQTLMELSVLRSLFNQGQFIYCIPFGGMTFAGCPTPFPFYAINNFPTCDSYVSPVPYATPSLPSATSESTNSTSATNSSSSSSSSPTPTPTNSTTPPPPPQSIVHVNVKNGQAKVPNKPGSDECNIGKDGIEIVIDLREYLPAEIFLNAEEKTIDVKACHTNSQGSKTFSRRYELPACIALDSVKCILSHDGFLMFTASWCKME